MDSSSATPYITKHDISTCVCKQSVLVNLDLCIRLEWRNNCRYCHRYDLHFLELYFCHINHTFELTKEKNNCSSTVLTETYPSLTIKFRSCSGIRTDDLATLIMWLLLGGVTTSDPTPSSNTSSKEVIQPWNVTQRFHNIITIPYWKQQREFYTSLVYAKLPYNHNI